MMSLRSSTNNDTHTEELMNLENYAKAYITVRDSIGENKPGVRQGLSSSLLTSLISSIFFLMYIYSFFHNFFC